MGYGAMFAVEVETEEGEGQEMMKRVAEVIEPACDTIEEVHEDRWDVWIDGDHSAAASINFLTRYDEYSNPGPVPCVQVSCSIAYEELRAGYQALDFIHRCKELLEESDIEDFRASIKGFHT